MSLIDAQYFWFGHEKVTYSMLEQTNFAFSVQSLRESSQCFTLSQGKCAMINDTKGIVVHGHRG